MTAARYDLTIDQGANFSVQLAVKESSSAKNLTGFFARAQLRSTRDSASAVASFEATVQSPKTGGIVNLSLPYETSDDIKAGVYYYDLEIYEAASAAASAVQVSRLLHGTAHVRREVTR